MNTFGPASRRWAFARGFSPRPLIRHVRAAVLIAVLSSGVAARADDILSVSFSGGCEPTSDATGSGKLWINPSWQTVHFDFTFEGLGSPITDVTLITGDISGVACTCDSEVKVLGSGAQCSGSGSVCINDDACSSGETCSWQGECRYPISCTSHAECSGHGTCSWVVGDVEMTIDELINLYEGNYVIVIGTENYSTSVGEVRARAQEKIPPPFVPTLSEWGMIAMAVLLLTAGAVIFTRRRPKLV